MSKNALGEMYGERAVMAQCALVVTGTKTVAGIERSMIGGVVLDGFGGRQWERWRGTVILIPEVIDVTRKPCASRLDQMVTGYLNADIDAESFWKSSWHSEEW